MAEMEQDKSMDVLEDNKEAILATKRLFEIHRIDPSLNVDDQAILEQILVANFNHLTGDGGIMRDEYYNLLQRCESVGNFSELALITARFLIGRDQKYLEDHPDLPASGDVLNPGVPNIRGSIEYNQAGIQAVEECNAEGIPIPIHSIGGPTLREIPDWLLVIKEKGMRMSEVYEQLGT